MLGGLRRKFDAVRPALPLVAAAIAFFAAKGPRWSQDASRYGVVRERMFSQDGRQLFTIHAPPVPDGVDTAIPYTLVRWDVTSGKMIDAKLLSNVEGRAVSRWVGFNIVPESDMIVANEGPVSRSGASPADRYSIHDPKSGECIHGPVSLDGGFDPRNLSKDRRWYLVFPPILNRPNLNEIRVVDAAADRDVALLRSKEKISATVEVASVSHRFSPDGRSIAVMWVVFNMADKRFRKIQRFDLCIYDLPSGRLREVLPLDSKWWAVESWTDNGWISLVAKEPDPQQEGATFRRTYRFNLAAMDVNGAQPPPLRVGDTNPRLPKPSQCLRLHPELIVVEQHDWLVCYDRSLRKEYIVLHAWLKRLGDRLNVDLLQYLPERDWQTKVYNSSNGRLMWELPRSKHRWRLSPHGRLATPVQVPTRVELYDIDQTPPWLAALAAGMGTASVLAVVSCLGLPGPVGESAIL